MLTKSIVSCHPPSSRHHLSLFSTTPAFGHPFYIEGELLPFLVIIQLDEDEQQRGETPQRGTAVADEG